MRALIGITALSTSIALVPASSMTLRTTALVVGTSAGLAYVAPRWVELTRQLDDRKTLDAQIEEKRSALQLLLDSIPGHNQRLLDDRTAFEAEAQRRKDELEALYQTKIESLTAEHECKLAELSSQRQQIESDRLSQLGAVQEEWERLEKRKAEFLDWESKLREREQQQTAHSENVQKQLRLELLRKRQEHREKLKLQTDAILDEQRRLRLIFEADQEREKAKLDAELARQRRELEQWHEQQLEQMHELKQAAIAEIQQTQAEEEERLTAELEQDKAQFLAEWQEKEQRYLDAIDNLQSDIMNLAYRLSQHERPALPQGILPEYTAARELIDYYWSLPKDRIWLNFDRAWVEQDDSVHIRVVPKDKALGERALKKHSNQLARAMALAGEPEFFTVQGTIEIVLIPARSVTPGEQKQRPPSLGGTAPTHPEFDAGDRDAINSALEQQFFMGYREPGIRFRPYGTVTREEEEWVLYLWKWLPPKPLKSVQATVRRIYGIEPGANQDYEPAAARVRRILDKHEIPYYRKSSNNSEVSQSDEEE